MQTRAKTTTRGLAQLCVLGLGLASLLGGAGRWWWLLDLFSHFRVQYLWGLGIATLPLLLLKNWRWAAAGGVFLALNLYALLPLYLGSPAPADAQKPQLDLLVFNVNYGNAETDELVRYLADQDVDVLVILEATPGLRDKLSLVLPAHHLIAEPRADAFGIMVYSRLPFESQKIVRLAESDLVAIQFQLRKEETSFSIVGIHTMPPVGAANSALRDHMLDEVAAWAKPLPHAIVLGDLNATPWSHAFADFLEEGELVNSQVGFGVQSSWPADFWPFSIPIDHALHSPDLTTVNRSVGPFLGSDHRPLRLRIGVAH